MFDFLHEIKKYKEQMVSDLRKLLQIPSTYDENSINEEMPFGKAINDALQMMLELAKKDGFDTYNDDGYVGVISYGSGEPFGVLCHLDVVPAGHDWTYEAYGAHIVDGKIFARGAMDDKGPLMCAYYALKMLKDLNIKMHKKIEFILGTDEETKWRGISHYQKHHELPERGFSPDADFPLIYGEKGILRVELKSTKKTPIGSIKAGERFNVVIDEARFSLEDERKQSFLAFLALHNLKGYIDQATQECVIKGISAHAMEPFKGVNAGTYMAQFLANDDLLLSFISEYFHLDHYLKKADLACVHLEMGELTANVGVIEKTNNVMTIGIDMRYPIGFDVEKLVNFLEKHAQQYAFTYQIVENKTPHYLDPSDPFVTTLYDAYVKYTGDKLNKPKTIGGGTYARVLKKGVAFGMEMPGALSMAHQKDECVSIDDLMVTAAIYAESLYKIGKEDETKKL